MTPWNHSAMKLPLVLTGSYIWWAWVSLNQRMVACRVPGVPKACEDTGLNSSSENSESDELPSAYKHHLSTVSNITELWDFFFFVKWKKQTCIAIFFYSCINDIFIFCYIFCMLKWCQNFNLIWWNFSLPYQKQKNPFPGATDSSQW